MSRANDAFLDRRALLRGAGGAAIALPLLHAMQPRRARAATGPKRFIVFYWPGGTVMNYWRPTGTETDFTLPYILAPLEPHKKRLLVIDGLQMAVTSEGFGHPHSRGMGGVLTGQPLNSGPYETCGGKAGFANGPSVDQVIAGKIAAGTKWKSLELAIRWPTDRRDGGKSAPTNQITFQAANQPVPMATDPQAVFTRLFSELGANAADLAAERARSKSILDTVGRQYTRLAQRLPGDDRARLEAHLTKIQEVEKSLGTMATTRASCTKPDIGAAFDYKGDAGMPKAGKVMTDMLVMALACDLTRVATLQFVDSQAYNTFPWLNFRENHHAYQHDHGYQPEALKVIYRWYMEQLLYLANSLAAVPDGDGTLLDSTAILCVSEISHPNSHDQRNMPFMILGNAGGAFRTGRWVKTGTQPHNNLLHAVANAYGVEATSFGKAKYSTGALAGL